MDAAAMGATGRHLTMGANWVAQLLDEQLLGRRSGGDGRGARLGGVAANLGIPAPARRRHFRFGSGDSGDQPAGRGLYFLATFRSGAAVVGDKAGQRLGARLLGTPAA